MQTWQGGARVGDGGERWGCSASSPRYSSLEGKLSSAITFTFPNLKFSLYVILRVLSVLEKGSHDLKRVLEKGSHDLKVLAMLD